MASWQPPIPSGALYSKPARKLGAGVALLGYLYDTVLTDGWVDVNLHEAAVAMDAPYPTVKSWWQMIKVSGILAEIQDRGRNGIRARFDDYWLDWRILSVRKAVEMSVSETSRYPEKPETPTPVATAVAQTVNGTSDDPDYEDGKHSGVIREVNGSYSGSSDVPIGQVYKVLHDTQETLDSAVAFSNAPAALPAKKKRTPKQEPQSPIEIRQAVAAVSQIDLKTGLKEDRIQVNRVAGELWSNQRQPDQSAESFAADISKCGRWGRQTQHPYKGSEQRIPPAALIKFWPGWRESVKKAKPAYLNGHTNGTQAPHDYSQDLSPYSEEYRAQMRAGRQR